VNLPAAFDGLAAAAGLPAQPLHLAVGMFDGVHLGHRAVLDAAVQSARRCGGLAGVLTFWPHPSRLFNPEDPVRLIQSPDQKNRLLFAAGMDVVIAQPFDRAFSTIEAEDFLPYLRRALPSLTTLYVGENWRFGRGRRGDIGLLIAEAKNARLSVVSAPRINRNGEPISSTRIRTCLREGRLAEANALLGYSYFAEGVVRPGKRLGRTLGFPTLNIGWEPDLVPRFGVYAVTVGLRESRERRPAVANYGLRPTVESTTAPRLEVHVLGDCPWTEGDELVIEWQEFIREERVFPGVEALAAQIAKDREKASEFFLR
jgi:riboflavin kinase/FMN adenylyltransferase